jgi:hypothetical protein
MTPAIAAMIWRGVTPPAKIGGKTTCPKCSAGRRKSTERCLRVVKTDRAVEFGCYHCGWHDCEVLA